jgi:hypothetical protein
MAKKLTFLDLRKELDTMLESVGFSWVALRSVDLSTPCTECKKPTGDHYDQPSPTCTSCMGIGYLYIDKIVKGFRYMSSPGFDFRSNIGMLNTETQVYILEHDKAPKETDYVLELNLDEDTGAPSQPFEVTKSFKIQSTFAARGDKGRIELWRCFVEERNLENMGKSIISKGYLQ